MENKQITKFQDLTKTKKFICKDCSKIPETFEIGFAWFDGKLWWFHRGCEIKNPLMKVGV